jgi:hypothetical protein
MKWWSVWRMKFLHAPKVKPKAGSPRKTKPAQAMGTNVATNVNGAKVSWGFRMTR